MLLCFCAPTLAVGRANEVKRIKDTLNPFSFALLRLKSKVILSASALPPNYIFTLLLLCDVLVVF